MLRTEKDVCMAIEADPQMMAVLHAVKQLQLPDSWVAAGFVRGKVWDLQHGYTTKTELPDVDVVYFDAECVAEAIEKVMEHKLREWLPDVPWSVKNQARMHLVNGFSPYHSTEDAIAHYPETATALAVRLDERNRVELLAPLGIDDAIQLKLRPTPSYWETGEQYKRFKQRLTRKNWRKKWPNVEEIIVE